MAKRDKYNKYNASWRANADRSRNDPLYKKFCWEIRKRDKYKCNMPGCSSKSLLQVHHIIRWADSPHLRYEPRNAILLCRKCHDSIKNKEVYYIEMFMRIIEEKYKDKGDKSLS
jgi:5-methylcytosine-specific restriction endonuclease McrA